MKFTNPLIVVNDMEKAKQFYQEVLGLNVILDFGANVTLAGGISLQTKKSWMAFINKQEDEIQFECNNAELYFEEENFDSFIEKINNITDIQYVHPVIEHSWGQRVVRFYDLDKHIIEIGESMLVVCKRFMKSGLSIEETAKRMDVPVEYVQSCIK
ncbi:VOC family protein [uncultured Clostridium sp.]|uniref:VOC family protein n=1 Tax=uncultured Clostridium sp. TaxID=59620 RepID=UPI0028E317C1|nr:VOC family protein [uncultured Clostridium sp.]